MQSTHSGTQALNHAGTRFCDLHLHTRYSDGAYTPSELVQTAIREEFSAVAVTDHDTLDAIPESLEAGRKNGLEVIAGVEITCGEAGKEIHMLAYFFGDAWKHPQLQAVLEHSKQVRRKRIEGFVARLNELNVSLELADVLTCSDGGTLGRPHVAMALVNRGFVNSIEEAFERFLRRGRPAYVERHRMTTSEAIGHVNRAGGVAVLAHPGLNKVDHLIANMAAQGLGGVEVWHPRHSPAQSDRYLRMADRLGLLATGGSDCHGPGRGGPLIGSIKVPYERVEALKKCAADHSSQVVRSSHVAEAARSGDFP